MANNLRSITELPVLIEVPDGTYTVVVDGGTAKLAPYGGGGAEAVEVTYTTADMLTFTCDKTYAEMYEALVASNGIAVAKLSLGGAATLGKTGLWGFKDDTAMGGEGASILFMLYTGDGFTILSHGADDTITTSTM